MHWPWGKNEKVKKVVTLWKLLKYFHMYARVHTQECGYHTDVLCCTQTIRSGDRREKTTGKVKSSQSSLGSSITIVSPQFHPCVLRTCPAARKSCRACWPGSFPLARCLTTNGPRPTQQCERPKWLSVHLGGRSGSFCPPEIRRIDNILLPVFINLWLTLLNCSAYSLLSSF